MAEPITLNVRDVALAATTTLHRECCDPLRAIEWALDRGLSADARVFLTDWRMGDFGEWADYVEAVRVALEAEA